MTLTLHDYQSAAVSHLHRHPRAGLFLDMGLGKTACVLSALTPDHLPVLVTAPKRVAELVWPEECPTWRPDLSVAYAVGEPAQRKAALESGADIVVIGRDNLADAIPYAIRFNTFVLDELSGFKTRGTARWKSARRIAHHPQMKYVWGLTGTPSPNGLMDLWAQMFLLDKGARLSKTLTGFRSRYFMPGRQLANGVITEWIIRDEAEAAIHRKLEDICLSMGSEGRIDLPEVIFNRVVVPLLPKVRHLYKTIKRDMVADLEELGLMGEVHSADTAAALSSKLSQISAGFMYVRDADLRNMEYDVIHWENVRAVQEIVEGTGSPVLVFYRFTAERDMIMSKLAPGTVHDINEPDVQKKWNAGEIPVLLTHPASAGHGLNLQKGPGHTIVWASLPWSLEEWEQGNKRLHRQGQKNNVVIHTLQSPRTVDEDIWRRLYDKIEVQDALMRHLESVL